MGFIAVFLEIVCNLIYGFGLGVRTQFNNFAVDLALKLACNVVLSFLF